jgi:hypothetical protein
VWNLLHVVVRTVWVGVGVGGAGVSAGLLSRVGKDGWVMKGHQRWDWGRWYGHHLGEFGFDLLWVCGIFLRCSGGGLYCGNVICA